MDEDNGWTNSSQFRHYCHFVSQYMHINLFCTIISFFCIEKFVLLPEEKKLCYYYKTIKYLGLRYSIKLNFGVLERKPLSINETINNSRC